MGANTKSGSYRFFLLAISCRPHPEASHPAFASGSGSPLPSLGAIRARRVPRRFSESRQRGWG
jgi:hypothetical protein